MWVCVCVTHAGRPACDLPWTPAATTPQSSSLLSRACLLLPHSVQTRAAMPRRPDVQRGRDGSRAAQTPRRVESTFQGGDHLRHHIRATAQKPGGARAEEGQAHTLVLRIVIEDLQQTVSPPARRLPSGP